MNWRAFNQTRQRYYNSVYKQTLRALNKHFAPVKYASFNTINNLETFLDQKPINDLYYGIYTRVYPQFAKVSYGEVNKMASKADFTNLWIAQAIEYVKTNAVTKIAGIVTTTREFIKRTIEQGLSEGLSIEKIGLNLRKKWTTLARNRAVLISRNEIISASNAGAVAGAKSAGIPGLKKKWIATSDIRTRDQHKSANGQTVPIDGLFEVNGETLAFPGDTEHGASASNTILCRCAVGWVVP